MYPQEYGSCNEAWVPRMSKLTAISIESVGWCCMSPENLRHNPSVSCCCVAMVDYAYSPGYFESGTRERGRDEMGYRVGKMGVMLRGGTRRSRCTKLEGEGSRGYQMFYSQRRHGRLAQLVRAWC